MPNGRSSGWPLHAPSPENMKVDVKDILSRVSGRVEHNPVSAFLDPLVPCRLPGFEHKVSEEVDLLLGNLIKGGVVFFWDEKDVNGCLRVDVVESEDLLIFINDFCWNFLFRDFTKNAFIHVRFL